MPGIEGNPSPRLRGERVVTPVVRADSLAERRVAARARRAFDPGVLVRRHRLGGELSAEPVELLDEHYPGAEARRGERRRHPAEAAADDEDIGTHLAGAARPKGSVRLDSELANHVAPARRLALDQLAEVAGRAAERLRAEVLEAILRFLRLTGWR